MNQQLPLEVLENLTRTHAKLIVTFYKELLENKIPKLVALQFTCVFMQSVTSSQHDD